MSSNIATREVTVYSKSNCQQCTATIRALNSAGINYQIIDLEEDTAALAKVKALGHYQAPVIIAGDMHWSGFQPGKIQELRIKSEAQAPQNPMNQIEFAHCTKMGKIKFSFNQDEQGHIYLGGGAGQAFRDRVKEFARLADYDNATLLVPGVPEANSAEEVNAAIHLFQKLLTGGLVRPAAPARSSPGMGV